jgi:type IV pilus assembly protein PilA
MKFRMKKEAGFSLVELMVVVGIIGILASLAMPKLQIFMAKAKIAEGKGVLSTVFALQQSYYTENSAYMAMAQTNTCPGDAGAVAIGFCRAVPAAAVFNNPAVALAGTGFTATISNRLPLCNGTAANAYTLTMNETGVIPNVAVTCN